MLEWSFSTKECTPKQQGQFRNWPKLLTHLGVSDTQLMKLCALQVHDLIALAAAAPDAITYSKGRRMWRRVDALPAAVRLRR